MATTSAPREVIELVERFDRNRDSYLAGGINETQLRQEFINPFFSCLGWDIENKQGYAPAYREVIFEDSLRVGAETKAPDYCFRIGGMRKFFVEAKKPAVNIATGVAPAFQLKRYAWTAKLPLSILTDFEEFAVYDCRARPFKTDKSSIGRIKFLEFKDYPVRWTELYETFSRDAVVKGSFDKFVEENRARKGTTEVDDAFLSDIERWRDLLARNIALRNPRLLTRELNFAVQRTIDRIIFLRICEDRLIEPYGQLQALLNGERVYPRLKEAFQRADDRYNSGIFHFRPEKNRPEAPDELSLKLSIDDKALKDIIANLYYPDSPYEFSVFPSEILGQVYEQFLGKVIRLTAGHQAKVEDKPEVRKAGGVYYTPTYIVDYIVKNTVGKLLEGSASPTPNPRSPTPASRPLTPAQASRLRILDPACGSGSFLLGAFQYLLNWHRDWYVKDGPEKHTKELFPAQGGDWRLTTAKKKEILLNNIYGVDIDQQAVEVTKLSLLLKVLEGESEQTIGTNLKLSLERALPDLGNNIKCGNSLIGPDFYQGEQQSLFDDEEQRLKVNAFDWQAEFPDIMKSGGFDAVIGNPPYRMVQPHNTGEPELAYYRHHYVVAEFKIELFHMFLQKGISLLRDGGRHGYIVPTTVLNNVYAEALRTWIAERCALESISVARQKVFADADVHTTVLLLRREADAGVRTRNFVNTTTVLSEQFVRSGTHEGHVGQRRFQVMPGKVWNLMLSEENAPLITRIISRCRPLGQIAAINRGLITGSRGDYFTAKRPDDRYAPILAGRDIERYRAKDPTEFVLFERPDSAGGCWNKAVHFASHKIVVRQIGVRPMATLLRKPIAVTGNLFTVMASPIQAEYYLLGIINSVVVDFFWRIMFADFKTSFPQVTIFSLSQIPVPTAHPTQLGKEYQHEPLATLVERMLKLRKDLPKARASDKTSIERQIAATDKQIDQLVYELYGLSEEEIRIVEGERK